MKYNNLSSDDKIQVCLTAKEWDLLIEDTFIDSDLTDSVVSDGNKRYIHWSNDDIDCVIGYVAEAANHVEDKQIAKRLDKLLDKIEKLTNDKTSKMVALKKPGTADEFVPDWARPDAKLRTTPYSKEELDRLTEGTIASIDDLEAWKNLVAMVGIEDATQTIRMALQSQQSVSVKHGH